MNTTENKKLAELEKEDPKGAPAKVRADHIAALNAPAADAIKELTSEVKAALKIEDDVEARLTARILRLENPGKL